MFHNRTRIQKLDTLINSLLISIKFCQCVTFLRCQCSVASCILFIHWKRINKTWLKPALKLHTFSCRIQIIKSWFALVSFCINHQTPAEVVSTVWWLHQDVKCPIAALIWNLSTVIIWLCKARGAAVAERLYRESNLVTIMLSHSSWETVGVKGVKVCNCDEGRCWRRRKKKYASL